MRKVKDLISFQLIIFIIFISILFFYLYNIDRKIQKYDSYKNDINQMIILNLELNNFLDGKDKFVNFDNIVFKTDLFRDTIKRLLNSNLRNEFGKDVYKKVEVLDSLYKKNLDGIERFKSKQSSNLNSIHYIYDLKTYLSKDDLTSEELKEVVNNTLFLIMQQFIKINENSEAVLENIKKMEELNSVHKVGSIALLISHTKSIIQNNKYILKIRTNSKELNIENQLKDINILLIKRYKEKLFYQLLIASFFFLVILVIVYIIYKEHKKNLNTKNQLLAFKYAVENSDNSVVLTDANKHILYVNDIFEKTTGFNKTEVSGSKPKMLSSGETPDETYAELNRKLDAGEKWEGEFVNRRKDGSIFYEKASIVPIMLDNEITNYLAIKLDITKYIEQNESLKLSSSVFDNIQEGLLVCDKDKNIIIMNKAFYEITGYSEKDLIGKKPNIFKSGHHDRLFYKKMWTEIIENGNWKGKVYDKRKDGEVIPLWLNISVIRDNKGEISKYIGVHTSLKEIIDTQKRADFLAYHDSLTSLPNRVKLESDLEYSIAMAKRNSLNLFVMFIDLDRFKMINDTLGHTIGDELLKIVSKRIKSVLRDTDLIARMGGDEFIVVLDTSRNKKSAGYVCEKILEIVKESIIIDNNSLNTSASIGVAMYPDDGEDITTLIKNADTAMYHAKNLGKDNYQYYNEQLSVDVHEQLHIEQALKDAVINEEIYLNYQPQYNLKTKEIIAFEALVRWKNKELGFISPDKFIPIAEDTGMIIDLGKYIFETACKDFIKFKEINQNLKYIAINISSVQFQDKNFVNDIFYLACKYNLEPKEIELEVTERYIMEYSQSNLNTMDELKDLGFRFSIDDFGTGYSSMSYLTQFPIDVLKVDKAFVDGTPDDNNNVQISKAIVALAKSLGYSVIAEGIEYEIQEEYLNSIDCDYGQGYLFSKPLSFEDAQKFLRT